MGSSRTEPLLGTTNHHLDYEHGDGKAPVGSFVKEFGIESKKLWKIAGPAILTSVFQYSLGAITQTFVGHIGELDLAAFSIENSVIAGLAFGVMVSTPPLDKLLTALLFSIFLSLHFSPKFYYSHFFFFSPSKLIG